MSDNATTALQVGATILAISGRVLPREVEFLEYGPATLRDLKAVEDAIVAGLARRGL